VGLPEAGELIVVDLSLREKLGVRPFGVCWRPLNRRSGEKPQKPKKPKQILRDEGVRALGTGLAPTLWRNCVWNSIYYGTMHRLEQAFDAQDAAANADAPQPSSSAALRAARQLGCGFAVGVFATCFNAPFDVVKSRFQAQLPAGMGVVVAEVAGEEAAPRRRRYERVFPTLAAIAREEGPRALYRGFVPKALRLGIGQTVGLAAFQGILDLAGVRERDAPEAVAAARRVEAEAAAEVAAGG
jgi:solute carrier family 25 2-oxodicarboxylate transporter 21